MRTKPILIAGAAALALAIPAVAQQANLAQPTQPAPSPAPSASPVGTQPAQSTASPASGQGEIDSAIEQLTAQQIAPPTPPVELPAHARRDPWIAGALNPQDVGLGIEPWGGASGVFLSTLMRRMDTPLASRWAHIGLRDALLAKTRAPASVNPVDWTAERAWLLLRLGEADAARMLVSAVDVDRFTPKMFQVAVQSALANGDPPGLCPLEDGIRKYDSQIRELVSAMCASLSGEPESASAQIDHARRFGRIGGIDLALAEKVVGAGANTGRAVTIKWDAVDRLTAWRFGLATATGLVAPDRLLQASTLQLRAFQARSPLLSPQDRLDSARIATGLGVFSSQSMIDLYSQIYDSTDPSDLPGTDAWQVRQAFVGKDRDARLAAIRKLLGDSKDSLQREASRALVARAATLIDPDPKLDKDAAEIISAMFAAGYDRQAARWANAVNRMDDEAADRCWAMLALGAPEGANIDVGFRRISSFIGRDKSKGRHRSALLVAALAGLGRINGQTVNTLNSRYGLGLSHQTSWTRMIDAAAVRGQAGTVVVLTGTGFQTASLDDLPSSHLYHSLAALRRTGQDFLARMIGAEALSRT